MGHNTSNKLKALQTKTNKNSVENFFNSDRGLFCIKLDITNGFVYNTTNGQFRTTETDTKPYTFDECIADGKDAIYVMWTNSYEANTITHDYTYFDGETSSFTQNTDAVNIKFKPGAYSFGFNTIYNENIDIDSEASYQDFTSIKNNPSFTLTFSKKQFHNGFNFKHINRSLYAFPYDTGFKLYTANVTRYFKLGRYFDIDEDENTTEEEIIIEVEFTHISNKFQKSGKAIEEYVFLSCFNSFFPWPSYSKDEEGHAQIDLDEGYLYVQGSTTPGVSYIQEEFYNACIQSATCFLGWELSSSIDGGPGTIAIPQKHINDDGTYYYETNIWSPKKLFPYKFRTASPKILNKKLTPVNNFTLISEINFTFDKYSDWKTMKQSQLTGDYDDKYKGEFSWNSEYNYDNIEDLNFNISQETDLSQYVPSWYANGFGVDIDLVSAEVTHDWADLNMLNFFNDMDILTMPFQFTQHISHLVKDTPWIGGIIDTLDGGIPLSWGNTQIVDSTDGDNTKKINGIIPTQFLDMCKKDWSNTSSMNGFLHYFTDKNGDKLGANNLNISFLYQLTDKLIFNDVKNSSSYSVDTSYLGLDWVPASLDNPFFLVPTSSLNNGVDWNHINFNYTSLDKSIVTPPKSFILTHYFNYNYGADAIKLSFFDVNKQPIGQLAQNTNSNFLQNDREWMNVINLNQFNNILVNGNVINWPNLPTPQIQNGNVTITLSSKNNGNAYVQNENSWDSNDGDARQGYTNAVASNSQRTWTLNHEVMTQTQSIDIIYGDDSWTNAMSVNDLVSSMQSVTDSTLALGVTTNYQTQVNNRYGPTQHNWANDASKNGNISNKFTIPLASIVNNQDGTGTIPANNIGNSNYDTVSVYTWSANGNTTPQKWNATLSVTITNNGDVPVTFTKIEVDGVTKLKISLTWNPQWYWRLSTTSPYALWRYDENKDQWSAYEHIRNGLKFSFNYDTPSISTL